MSIFERWYFGLCWNFEISYYRVLISWRILVSFRGFFENYIFAWWNIWSFHNSSFFAYRYFLKWLARPQCVTHHPLLSMRIVSSKPSLLFKLRVQGTFLTRLKVDGLFASWAVVLWGRHIMGLIGTHILPFCLMGVNPIPMNWGLKALTAIAAPSPLSFHPRTSMPDIAYRPWIKDQRQALTAVPSPS